MEDLQVSVTPDAINAPRFEGLRNLGRKAGKIAVCGAAAIASLTAAIGEVYADDPTLIFDSTVSYVTNESCDGGSDEASKLTQDAMALSEDPRHAEWREFLYRGLLPHHYEEADSALSELATETGLTIVPRAAYEARLAEADTVDEVTANLKDYLDNFSIEFNFADNFSVNEIGINAGYIDSSTVELERLKEISGYFFSEFAVAPVELIKYAGIKEVKLAEGLSKRDGEPLNALASYGNKRLYLNFDSLRERDISHEWGHFFDLEFCGLNGMDKDPEFNEVATSEHSHSDAVPEVWHGETGIVFNSTETSEIKADFYSQMLGSAYPKAQSPIVNEEFKELFSRITSIPQGESILKFYSAIWDRDVYDRELGRQVVPEYIPRN